MLRKQKFILSSGKFLPGVEERFGAIWAGGKFARVRRMYQSINCEPCKFTGNKVKKRNGRLNSHGS
jgi:hypothetical protein